MFKRLRLREAANAEGSVLVGDLVDIGEAAVRSDGTVSIRLISPGWGSRNHYYSAELLERDAATTWPAGTHMYWDHPGITEQSDRSERSLRDLAGTLATAARWVPDHTDGPGVYAQAQVITPYRSLLAEMAPHIGVSIRAIGQGHAGTVDGKQGTIIDRLVEGPSVDFVTKAGRGGQVLALIESARSTFTEAALFNDDLRDRLRAALTDRCGDDVDSWCYVRDFNDTTVVYELGGKSVASPGTFQLAYTLDDGQNAVLSGDPTEVKVTTTYTPVTTTTQASEEDQMDEAQIKEAVATAVKDEVTSAVTAALTEAGVIKDPAKSGDELAEARTENARLKEAGLVRDAKDHVTEALGKVNGLPQPTKARLTEALSVKDKIPVDTDGKLDEAKFATVIDEAVKAEVKYLAESTGSPVSGVGGAGATVSEADTSALEGAFARLGMSEAGAKVAAAGRR